MIKTVVFTNDIDRTYLCNIKKSKRTIRHTKSQNFSEKMLIQNDKPDLIRKKVSFSDEECSEKKKDENVDTVTDTDGLRQLAEFQEKQRELKNSNQKNNKKNNGHHFRPTPPQNPVPPGTRRRILPLQKIKIQGE